MFPLKEFQFALLLKKTEHGIHCNKSVTIATKGSD